MVIFPYIHPNHINSASAPKSMEEASSLLPSGCLWEADGWLSVPGAILFAYFPHS